MARCWDYAYKTGLILTTILGLAGCISEQTKQAAASVPGPGITVYAAGDIADCTKVSAQHSNAMKTATLVEAELAKDKNAVVLTLGDNTYPVGLLKEFTNCYEPTWGRFKPRTYPSPGNHDYYTPQAMGYYDYFGEAAGPDRRGYYSFKLDNWLVISLNSYLKPREHAVQLEWLKAELQQNPAKCTLAYWHHPVYSSGGHGSSPRMIEAWKILYDANAEVILTSHDHNYERFGPQDANGRRDDMRGIRQFVVGTGGAQLTPLWFRKSNSEVSNNSVNGVLKIVLKETGYEWEFLPVDKNAFTDRGAALCH